MRRVPRLDDRRMIHRVLFKLAEDLRALELFAGSRVRWIDGFPPRCRIFFVDELCYRNLCEIRIAKEFGLVDKVIEKRVEELEKA